MNNLHYLIKTNGYFENDDFMSISFGRAINDYKKAQLLITNWNKLYIDVKGKAVKSTIKKELKSLGVKEYYIVWKQDKYYKDDVITAYIR